MSSGQFQNAIINRTGSIPGAAQGEVLPDGALRADGEWFLVIPDQILYRWDASAEDWGIALDGRGGGGTFKVYHFNDSSYGGSPIIVLPHSLGQRPGFATVTARNPYTSRLLQVGYYMEYEVEKVSIRLAGAPGTGGLLLIDLFVAV